ncbi:hypothetical protein Tco_0539988 [Tanacetum coccineum]
MKILFTTTPEGVSTARAIPKEVSTVEPDMDLTLAEALVDLLKSGKKKSPKLKARGISFQDPEEVARREVISPPVSKISAKDKGKAIMTELEKPSKKKDQIQIDEELALRLHAEEQAKFKRLQKERDAQEEASRAAIYEEIDNIQAMIEADEKLAARVQAEEQELYFIEEKSRLLVEMIEERKRNIGGYKHNQLKGKSYKEIQKLFDKTYKQVNSFVPIESDDKDKDSEKKAGGYRKKTLARKRARENQSEESAKRQKMKDDAKKEKLRAHLDIISGDDVAIIRANGSTKSYKIFTEMLDDFDRHDVLDLYRLVKESSCIANEYWYCYSHASREDISSYSRDAFPTKTQMRNKMYTYLNNIGGYKHNQLKGKSYEEIQKLFDKTYKQVNSFVPIASDDKEKGSERRLEAVERKHLLRKEQMKSKVKSSKRQKMEDDAEKEELRAHLNIIPGDDVADVLDLYRMLSGKLEVDNESEMAFELLRFTRSQIEKYKSVWKNPLKKYIWSWNSGEDLLKNLQLEAEEESTMAFELIKFIKSLLEEGGLLGILSVTTAGANLLLLVIFDEESPKALRIFTWMILG